MEFTTILSMLLQGMVISVEIFLLTLLFSLPLGMGVALCRLSKNCIIRNLARIYISVLRGTPLMLQLFVVYFGPYYLFGWNIGGFRFTAVIIAFVINYAAYFAEIYRSGIESMPVGQYEAAKVLGYTRSQTFMKIIMPQVIKRVLPPVTNEVITLIKDTSLAFAIAVAEMFTVAKAISSSQRTMIAFIMAGVLYYIFNLVVAMLMEKAEKKLRYYR
jgi:polar amino acid transport system permease protein